MIKVSTEQPKTENNVFAALADGNRRKIVELLHKQDSTLLELSESFSISFQALSKHIKVLENAQVLTKRKQGKYRVLSLNKQSLRHSLEWMATYSDFWTDSFDKLGQRIDDQQRNDNAE